MNEIQRLVYLDALGIDSYISRSQLPAAAITQRLRLVRPAAEISVAVAPSVSGEAIRESLQVTGLPESEAPPITLPAGPGVDESAPMFSVASCYLGGYLWLDEIPRSRDLGDNYPALLHALAVALGWDGGDAVVERFDWPMHYNQQLAQGPEAARHGFEGFVRARLERHPVRGVVLLGPMQAEWLDRGVFTGLELVATVSAWQMLKQPELKAQAWRDLKRLASTSA